MTGVVGSIGAAEVYRIAKPNEVYNEGRGRNGVTVGSPRKTTPTEIVGFKTVPDLVSRFVSKIFYWTEIYDFLVFCVPVGGIFKRRDQNQ